MTSRTIYQVRSLAPQDMDAEESRAYGRRGEQNGRTLIEASTNAQDRTFRVSLDDRVKIRTPVEAE